MKEQPVENSQENQPITPEQPVENSEAPEAEISAPIAEDKTAELINDLQRTRADFENYRKQSDLQKSQAVQLARLMTVEKFLPLIDDFSRAISAYPEQLKPLEKNLQKTLKTLGLAMIDSTPGAEFNPDFHEAISVDDSDGETEIITETLRPGYLYDGNVVRTAMVKVGHTSVKK